MISGVDERFVGGRVNVACGGGGGAGAGKVAELAGEICQVYRGNDWARW